MFTNITRSEFSDTFTQSDTYKNNFSYDGLTALYEWHNDLEEDTGEPIQFDMIGICCDFNEYESLDKFNEDYGKNFKTIDEIAEETTVIKIDDERFIIQAY